MLMKPEGNVTSFQVRRGFGPRVSCELGHPPPARRLGFPILQLAKST